MQLPRMLKVARSIPGQGRTDLYCAGGTQASTANDGAG